MNVCGIIIAKENSNRFPGKNYHEVSGKPMFWHAVELMMRDIPKEDICICTDSEFIEDYCKKEMVNIIYRPPNVRSDDEPYMSVLKFAYQRVWKQYDIIVTVLANSIEHNISAIRDGIEVLKNHPEVTECRSFSDDGKQSGIFIFRESAVLKPVELYHIQAIKSNGREIHYREELEK